MAGLNAYDLETECTVVGTILHYPEAMRRLKDTVIADDFFHPLPRKIFNSALSLYKRNLVIDTDTVEQELKKTGAGITKTEILEVWEHATSLEKAMTTAVQLSESAGKRRALRGVEKLLEITGDETTSLDEVTSGLNSLLAEVSRKGQPTTFRTGVALRDEYLSSLLKSSSRFSLTGLEGIDKEIIDLVPGELTYVAARPGTGKSAMLIQSARINAEKGIKVGYISTEINHTKVFHRMVSAVSRIPGNEILKMDAKVLAGNKRFNDAVKRMTEIAPLIDSTGPFNTKTISQKIRKMVFEQGCEIVYVDHIGHIQSETAKSNNDRLTDVSLTLKSLATELSIPIVGASQVNREVTKRGTTKLNISDLRDSGSLEQDASVVVLMYVANEVLTATGMSERDYLDSTDEVQITFDVAKHRNGPVFSEKLIMERKYGSFEISSEVNRSF